MFALSSGVVMEENKNFESEESSFAGNNNADTEASDDVEVNAETGTGDSNNAAKKASKKSKGQKKPDFSRKAMIICGIVAAAVVVAGIVIAVVLMIGGKSDGEDILPPDRTEEIDGSDEEHTKLY